MARIIGSALRSLSRIYGIRGGEVTTDAIDLSSVQIVQDASPVAAEGGGPGRNGGWCIATVGAAWIAPIASVAWWTTLDLYDALATTTPWPAQLAPEDFRFYAYGMIQNVEVPSPETLAAVTIDSAALVLHSDGRPQGPRSIAPVNGAADLERRRTDLLLAQATNPTIFNVGVGSGFTRGSWAWDSERSWGTPLPILPGQFLRVRCVLTDTGAAIVGNRIHMGLVVRAVPRGLPPL